jgi:hypothetical protein
MRQLRLVVSKPEHKTSRWWWVFLVLLFVPALGAAVQQGTHGSATLKQDVAAYCGTVFGPMLAEERAAAGRWASSGSLTGKNVTPERWLRLCEDEMLPQYRNLLSRAEGYIAATGEVKELNRRLVQTCRAAVDALERYRDALRQKDARATSRAAHQLSMVDFDAVGRDVYRMAKHHQVAL